MLTKNLAKISCPLILALNLVACSENPASSAKQLILVTGKNWEATTGTLQRYERTSIDSPWQKVGNKISVNLGQNGMAWGSGLHGTKPLTTGPVADKEGLKRSPVGAFSLPLAFGNDDSKTWSVKLPYQKISKTIFCSGDPLSKNYNRIVDITTQPKEDWSKGEDMQDYVNKGWYTYGAVIAHNYSPTISGHGNCFFMHVWKGAGIPTAGCTAMAKNNAKAIISWLDPQMHPILIQLPEVIYPEMQKKWGLPILTTSP